MKYRVVEMECYVLILNSIRTVWSVTGPEEEENYYSIRASVRVLGVLKGQTLLPTLNASKEKY